MKPTTIHDQNAALCYPEENKAMNDPIELEVFTDYV